jgi:formate-dependent nitrite reductase cytochrome c552 subunit
MMHLGGGIGAAGIHGMHMGPGVRIRYAHSDAKRQVIPWVEYRDAAGKTTAYTSSDAKGAMPGNLDVREMDCIDCHNRPTHAYQLPDRAVDLKLADGSISPALPFAKKTAVALLKAAYASRAEAEARIPAAFAAFYREKYPAVSTAARSDVERSAQGVLAVYQRNIFPEMNVTWGTYPNNIGHTDSPGCFRCHDDSHVAAGGAKVTQDCGACHNMLAMDEAQPKVLVDLGLTK